MPFSTSIVFAAFFAIIFHPLFSRFERKISASLSALFTVIITIIIILIPIGLFVQLVARKALDFVATFDTQNIVQLLNRYNIAELQSKIENWLNTAGENIYLIAKDTGSSIMNFSFLFFVFLFLYYYFLKDGRKILEILKSLLPFTKKQNTLLINQCKSIAGTVFSGSLISSLIAGVIAFIGFYIFKVPGALILAILATILSLIPTIGAFFVYLLAALIIIPTGGYISSVYLLIYFIVMDLIARENFIKPAILDNKLSIHPVLIFFALIGGIQTFGSTGILYGPLIVILFVSVLNFVLELKVQK